LTFLFYTLFGGIFLNGFQKTFVSVYIKWYYPMELQELNAHHHLRQIIIKEEELKNLVYFPVLAEIRGPMLHMEASLDAA
jgi:hypothetical protein